MKIISTIWAFCTGSRQTNKLQTSIPTNIDQPFALNSTAIFHTPPPPPTPQITLASVYEHGDHSSSLSAWPTLIWYTGILYCLASYQILFQILSHYQLQYPKFIVDISTVLTLKVRIYWSSAFIDIFLLPRVYRYCNEHILYTASTPTNTTLLLYRSLQNNL